MRTPTIEELKAKFTELGYKWEPFHLIGIRSAANEPNKFDDLIGVVNGNELKFFTGTTNPGTFWLNSPMNPKGAAVLKCGQYVDSWVMGLHPNRQRRTPPMLSPWQLQGKMQGFFSLCFGSFLWTYVTIYDKKIAKTVPNHLGSFFIITKNGAICQ